MTGLTIWTVYDHPKDFPNTFVARRWAGVTPTQDVIISPDLEDLRRLLAFEGLTCLARADGDDPTIVETWL
jgi:hypothetical protein